MSDDAIGYICLCVLWVVMGTAYVLTEWIDAKYGRRE